MLARAGSMSRLCAACQRALVMAEPVSRAVPHCRLSMMLSTIFLLPPFA